MPSSVRDRDACELAAELGVRERMSDPCGATDLLARCAGLPPAERTRIAIRCEAERTRTRRE